MWLPRGANSFGCRGSMISAPVVAARGCREPIFGTFRKSPENLYNI